MKKMLVVVISDLRTDSSTSLANNMKLSLCYVVGGQSLKLSNPRYIPAPVQLQITKSSNDSGDSNVSLVPQGGASGWSNTSKETKDDTDKSAKNDKKEGE
jgi:hypothetical protein